MMNSMKKLFSTSTKNKFSNLFSNNKLNFSLLNNKSIIASNNFYFKSFCTKNQISEKESLDLIEAGVFEVLKSAAKCKYDKLSRSASFEELGFDSLDQVELVVAMEEKFGINISDDDSLKIQSVLDAIQIMHSNYVKEKVNVGTVVEKDTSTDVSK
jgi:NADH dehydrogenase (ubiquinone) 1 alpha/beta subcomplex 1